MLLHLFAELIIYVEVDLVKLVSYEETKNVHPVEIFCNFRIKKQDS
jgi:hypothetical protein